MKLHRVVAARDAEQNTYIAAARDYVEREQRGRKKNRRLAQRRRPSRSRLSRWRRRADNHPRQPRRALGRPAGDRDNKRLRVCCEWTRARERGVPGREVRNKRPSEARARELSCALSAMFRWLRGKRRIAVDPCAGMERPEGSQRRERVLNAKADVRRADELSVSYGFSAAGEVSGRSVRSREDAGLLNGPAAKRSCRKWSAAS